MLTIRELLGTWEENAAGFTVGETVVGIVRSVEEYGTFIEIAPNLAGLAESCTDLVPGQAVSVYIKNILPEKMKIKLVIVNHALSQRHRFELKYFITEGHTGPLGVLHAGSPKRMRQNLPLRLANTRRGKPLYYKRKGMQGGCMERWPSMMLLLRCTSPAG